MTNVEVFEHNDTSQHARCGHYVKNSNLYCREYSTFQGVEADSNCTPDTYMDSYRLHQWLQSSFHVATKWPGRIVPHGHFSSCATLLFVPHHAKGKTLTALLFSLSLKPTKLPVNAL